MSSNVGVEFECLLLDISEVDITFESHSEHYSFKLLRFAIHRYPLPLIMYK